MEIFSGKGDKAMNEKDILKLHTLTEDEQVEALDKADVLQYNLYGTGIVIECKHLESLADCAERLWRENKDKARIAPIYDLCAWNKSYDDGVRLWYNMVEWFAMDALPIHRIQACLLVKAGA